MVTERYVVIVDTMATPELAAAILESMRPFQEGRQALVINTHADYDHCWGNAIFAAPGAVHPAPIIAHEQARQRLLSDEARASLHQRQQKESRFANVRLVAPTITFTKSLRIDGGDLSLELIPTPGHTVDHCSLWIPELRLLLAGDAAEYPFPFVEEARAVPILRRSLERMAALKASMVIPCHGGTTDPALIAQNIAYFDEIELRVSSALAAGLVSPDWREREDSDEMIGLPYAQVLQNMGANPATIADLYRSFHLAAVRATLMSLQQANSQ